MSINTAEDDFASSGPLENCATIVDVIARRAKQEADRRALVFLNDGEASATTWTYSALWDRARAVAALLEAHRGQRVVLLYESSLEYVAAFLGTLAAGAVAVPATNRMPERLLGILRDCEPAALLATERVRRSYEKRQFPEHARPRWICTDSLEPAPSLEPSPLPLSTDLALLQYTSGSTRQPRGVRVTHHNVLANCEAVHRWLGPDPARRGCIWLPPFHDMGLLGGVLEPLYAGFPLVFFSPAHFMQRPFRWLKAISDHRATLSGGPDFAYRVCAERVDDEELESLDLSSWKEAFCGAEPVRADTLRRFAERFAKVGFDAKSFNPCYGLAEATLIVSGKRRGTSVRSLAVDRAALAAGRVAVTRADGPAAQELVSNGVPAPGTEIQIVDPETAEPQAAGRVGEIWVRGPGIAAGYWNASTATEHTFRAELAGACTASASARFLRTGDIGFVHEGELYVNGRLKDVIVVAGRNHHAEDLEATVERAHPRLRQPGAIVAIGVDRDDAEELVILAELVGRRDFDAASDAVKSAIRRDLVALHQLSPIDIVFYRVGTLPRTTSGKLRRAECRRRYLSGAFEPLRSQRPEAAVAPRE